MPADGISASRSLVARVQSGDPAALARALTRAENGDEQLMQALRPHTGNALVVGFTGPPGAGKSTLLNALIRDWRVAGQRIAVLAVDPDSPLTGGAVLGDRTRMGEHSMDKGVFIRSISTRGHLGGLSAATQDMIDVLDAAGWSLILLETVGTGQSETEVSEFADVKVVVSAPGLGDEIQAIKAGILEIADILVVNKSDRPGAEQTANDLASMLDLPSRDAARNVPVVRTCATDGEGVADLRQRIEQSIATRGAHRHTRQLASLRLSLADALAARVRFAVRTDPKLESVLKEVAAGQMSKEEALRDILDKTRIRLVGSEL